MIIVTGAAGFIGSCLVWKLNQQGIRDIVVVDKFHSKMKWKNLVGKDFVDYIDRDNLFSWLKDNNPKIDTIFHMGASSSTEETDVDYIIRMNFEYSKKLWNIALDNNASFIYASSAATYGSGENGFVDNDNIEFLKSLKPLNPYGFSKCLFDQWAVNQENKPGKWCGLKFFNVYGPNEAHKERGASVAYHLFHQAKDKQVMNLYKSYREDYKHGQQLRDFVYVKDLLDVMFFMHKNQVPGGLYNIGSGKARSFNDLALNIARSMMDKIHKDKNHQDITTNYTEMPIPLRDKYQYYTQADLNKLRKIGYNQEFSSLENGISDYISNYLLANKYL